MRFSCFLFLIAISMELAVSLTIKTVLFTNKTDTDFVELTRLKTEEMTAFTLCMRVATEITEKRDVILFSHRSEHNDELNVWREKDGRLSLFLHSQRNGVKFQVPQPGSLETHLCVTWDSSTGATAFFMNGRKSLTKIYGKGHTVPSEGRVILGQDADDDFVFDINQCFLGEIGDVNLWDSVLSDSIISDMFSGKRETRGNVLDWEAIKLESHGGAIVIDRDL